MSIMKSSSAVRNFTGHKEPLQLFTPLLSLFDTVFLFQAHTAMWPTIKMHGVKKAMQVSTDKPARLTLARSLDTKAPNSTKDERCWFGMPKNISKRDSNVKPTTHTSVFLWFVACNKNTSCNSYHHLYEHSRFSGETRPSKTNHNAIDFV